MYEPDAPARLTALSERSAELSKAATVAAMPYEERRMLKWQTLVEQHHMARVSTA